MTELLAAVGGMSLTAGLTALVVLVLRWALVRLRAPAFVRLLLWVVVLFRMVCPVSFTSPWGAAALVEEALPTTAQVQTTREPVQQPGTAGVPAFPHAAAVRFVAGGGGRPVGLVAVYPPEAEKADGDGGAGGARGVGKRPARSALRPGLFPAQNLPAPGAGGAPPELCPLP